MSAEQAKALTLIPVASNDVTVQADKAEHAEQAGAPQSQQRLSPRAVAARTHHHPVTHRSRLSQDSFLAGDWTVVDVTRDQSELRILLSPGAAIISSREHEVLHSVLKAEPDRSISQRLGITRQCVCGHLGNVLAKLGVDSRFSALQVWRALGEVEQARTGRAQIAEVKLDGETLLSIRCPIAPRPEMEVRLSHAETHVAWLICEGQSNREIAFTRGTAERTVANQVASIFTKLELTRRFDVAQFVLGLR